MTFRRFTTESNRLVRDSYQAHQSVYRRNMEAVSKRHKNQLRGRGLWLDWRNALECDDDMSDAGHRICVLSVNSEVVVLPEDLRFV